MRPQKQQSSKNETVFLRTDNPSTLAEIIRLGGGSKKKKIGLHFTTALLIQTQLLRPSLVLKKPFRIR